MKRLWAIPLCLVAATALGKPVYLTVTRSYGTAESPVVDLAFESRGPVELRVLKPDDLDAFVLSQANLRRAYDQPPTFLNPGRYLAKGLDAVRSPGAFLLFALDPGLRQEISPSVAKRHPPVSRGGIGLAEGQEKLVGVPPGMTVVRTDWLNLDLGGAKQGFNVPGFQDWWTSDEGYEERHVSLPPLPAGVYVLQLVQGKVEGQVVLSVTDQTVEVQQTDGLALVRVAGRDGQPRAGAMVQAYLSGGRKGPSGTTDASGEVRLAAASPKLLFTVVSGSDTAIVDTDFYSTLAVSPELFLYTDRPLYRPGDRVRFRGVLRQPDSFLARLFEPRSRRVEVRLEGDKSAHLAAATLTADDMGTFAGSLDVPADQGAGVVHVVAAVDGQDHQAEARVQQYVKPAFYLEVQGDQETVQPGGTLTAKVRARRFAGGPAAGAAYEYFLYRTLVDTPAWIDDSGLGAQGSAVTYGGPATHEQGLSIPERLFSSVEERIAHGNGDSEDTWASAPKLDAQGEAEITVSVPAEQPGDARKPYRYQLSVRARDDQGTFANGSKSYFRLPSEVMGSLRPSAAIVLAGAPATLAIRSTQPSGRPFPAATGDVAFSVVSADGKTRDLGKQPIKTGDDGVARVPMPTADIGTVQAQVTLLDQQSRPWTGSASLLVAGRKGEEIARVPALTLQSVEGAHEPGDTAELVALFPPGWGPGGKDAGTLWITLCGAKIFDSRTVHVDGRTLVYDFTLEPRFGSSVYAELAYPTPSGRWEERSAPFRIVPSERILRVEVTPERPEATPLGEQAIALRVVDSRGRGVRARVSLGVVDKAIYALQAELRPSILDFFYPVGRNDVVSFFSSDFQGYGYGDALARALRGASPFEFASVKPPVHPVKPDEADTAYWNPSIDTDAEGLARVSFRLPSNQTQWVATAVAADASGRFGEGKAEFAAHGPLNVVESAPQFLRQGDEALGSVRLARAAGQPAVSLQLAVDTGQSLAAHHDAQTVQLASGGETVVPAKLEASTVGSAAFAVSIAGGETLQAQRRFPVEPDTSPETLEARGWAGGSLALDVPAGATVDTAELVLLPSTVAVSLDAVRHLLTYPYGCLEQLISTTIPDVAVLEVLHKTGALDQLDEDSRGLLAEATSRAVEGVSRILQLEVRGGGFVLWSGETTPSVPLTLIALDGLAYAADAGLVDRNAPQLAESVVWLADQRDLSPDMEITRAYVLTRWQHDHAAALVRDAVGKLNPGDDLYQVALAALAAEQAGVAGEASIQGKVAALVAQSGAALAKPAVYRLDAADMWAYPLRQVGLSAILTHAASYGQLDVQAARHRFILSLASGQLSTFDRATAILHSLWLLERDAKDLKSLTAPSVTVPGVAQLHLTARGGGLVASLPTAARQATVGSFDGVAVLRAHASVPVASLQPLAAGMSVERRYYLLGPSGRKPLADGQPVPQGADVFVELAVDAPDTGDPADARSAYYVVEDPVPAGFVPLEEDKTYRGAPYDLPIGHPALKHRSLDPERARFFFQEPAPWMKSPRVFGYVLRAQFPGKYSAPPATVQDMYVASIRGRGASASLTVSPSGASPARP